MGEEIYTKSVFKVHQRGGQMADAAHCERLQDLDLLFPMDGEGVHGELGVGLPRL